jgi:hypothetical protein
MEVHSVNNAGDVIGASNTGHFGYSAVRWDAGQSEPTILKAVSSSPLGNSDVIDLAINDSGDVAVSFLKYLGGTQLGYYPGIYRDHGTTTVELGLLSGGTGGGRAYDINNRGDVVGASSGKVNGVSGGGPVRWDAGATVPTLLQNLGSRQGLAVAEAVAINNVGDVVGYADDNRTGGNGSERAVRWAAGGTVVLALPRLPDANGLVNKRTFAVGINDSGEMVGKALMYSGFDPMGERAVRWSADGSTITDMGSGEAVAINNAGDIVGGVDGQLVLWPAGGSAPVPLNSLIDPASGLTIGSVTDISDTGIIAGTGSFDPDGVGPMASVPVGYRLTPVPEPGALGAAGLGVTASLLRGRRRRKP